MIYHVKELQFDARVSGPDPRFARLLLEQFGGANGELKAAMQYFTQAFTCRKPYPDKYDMLMDIAMEEFSHLEIVGATITMLLSGVNAELKNATEEADLDQLIKSNKNREHIAHTSAHFLIHSGGGPMCTDSMGNPWNGFFVNANGDLTVDLRSNVAAESRAKITYEYLMQFTDDPHVRESLGFLMTREIAHMNMFTAALQDIQPNFPPGILQGDPRATHTYFNLSNGHDVRGPWNQGQGPWPKGQEWDYIQNPVEQVRETQGQRQQPITGGERPLDELQRMSEELAEMRSRQIKSAVPAAGEQAWSEYPTSKKPGPVGSRR
ncbi:MAG TPA: manganese catalase family protein [Bryobacteraceae bacterium]|nr:manganese catalase family protein [Bryobacteraceae bacterium]